MASGVFSLLGWLNSAQCGHAAVAIDVISRIGVLIDISESSPWQEKQWMSTHDGGLDEIVAVSGVASVKKSKLVSVPVVGPLAHIWKWVVRRLPKERNTNRRQNRQYCAVGGARAAILHSPPFSKACKWHGYRMLVDQRSVVSQTNFVQ
jgi:predicted heme/steroid binding protein